MVYFYVYNFMGPQLPEVQANLPNISTHIQCLSAAEVLIVPALEARM